MNIINPLFQIILQIILLYFFLINTFYLIFFIFSMFGFHRYREMTAYINMKDVFQSPLTKPISIIAPAFNEEKSIVESVKSLLLLEFPLYEVIIVNDGSTDLTLKNLIEAFDLKRTNRVFRKIIETKRIKGIYASSSYTKLIVIDKLNGKKADALNAGLNVIRYPLFCSIDCDSLLERDALLKMIRPFLVNPDRIAGVGGIIRLSNGCSVSSGSIKKIGLPKNYLARFQIIEYFRSFIAGRMGLSMINSILILSGAFSVFRKDLVLACGGYRTNTVCEDMDLVVRMQKHIHEKKLDYRFSFVPDPICWTEAPETLKTLARQRNRWQRGLIESLFHSFKMFLNPNYGMIGLFAMPFYTIFEMIGPLVEILGYIIFAIFILSGNINLPFALAFFLLAVVYGVLLSLLAILLEEFSSQKYPKISDLFILTASTFLENILYRQFLTVVRVKALIDFLLGKKEWGQMQRKGFSK